MAILLPTAPIGVWLRMVLSRRLPDALFYRRVYALLLLTAVTLQYHGLAW